MKNTPLIFIQDITKSFTSGNTTRRVLAKVNNEIGEGEWVALLGQSGSGKSTLLNLISGMDKPDSGQIVIGGVDITGLGERERTIFRREKVGFIYQFFNLIPTLTIMENILLPLELNKLNNDEQARQLLDEVGLLDRKNDFPDRLSGGEQQRVAIVRALVHDPLIILADEPTGNLDKKTGMAMLNIMERLIRKRGKSLILVTHSNEVSLFADRVLLLEDGQLVEQHRDNQC